jgi:hypothetical protein
MGHLQLGAVDVMLTATKSPCDEAGTGIAGPRHRHTPKPSPLVREASSGRSSSQGAAAQDRCAMIGDASPRAVAAHARFDPSRMESIPEPHLADRSSRTRGRTPDGAASSPAYDANRVVLGVSLWLFCERGWPLPPAYRSSVLCKGAREPGIHSQDGGLFRFDVARPQMGFARDSADLSGRPVRQSTWSKPVSIRCRVPAGRVAT